MMEMELDTERWVSNNSPHSQELATKKLRIDRRVIEIDRSEGVKVGEHIAIGLDCSWCKEAMFDVYYKCKYHKMVFCEYCTTKEGQFEPKEYAKCRMSKIDKIECIWERIETK